MFVTLKESVKIVTQMIAILVSMTAPLHQISALIAQLLLLHLDSTILVQEIQTAQQYAHLVTMTQPAMVVTGHGF
jgi:hypothetical protein